MAHVVLSGTIVAGPATAGDSVLPKGVATIDLATSPDPKSAAVYLKGNRAFASGAFADTGWVGTGKDVVSGNLLFIKADGEMSFRLTTDDGLGGNVVSVVPVDGSLLVEFPSTKFLKLVEALGTANVEYIVSGD